MTNLNHPDHPGGRQTLPNHDRTDTDASADQPENVIQLPANKHESRQHDELYKAWFEESTAHEERALAAGLRKPTSIASRKRFPDRKLNPQQLKARRRKTKQDVMRPGREAIQESLRATEAQQIAVMNGAPISWDEACKLGREQWEREKQAYAREPIGQLYYLSEREACDWIYRHDHRVIGEGAINRTDAARVVDEQLAGARNTTGAPAQHRLACAVAKKLMWGDGPVVLKHAYQDLALTGHPMVEWAYDSPADGRPERHRVPADQVISENAVRDALNGYWRKIRKTEERRFIPGILDRVSPDFFHDLLLDTSIRIVESGLYPNAGGALSLDGTFARARRLQEGGVSDFHDELLNGGMAPEECSFVYHEGKGVVRGFNALMLSDPHAPVHTRAVRLVDAARNEARAAILLVEDHARRVWERANRDGKYPFPDERYIIGDKAFNQAWLCAELMFRFGYTPVFPWRKTMTEENVAWADNHGVPRCEECEGAPDMRYISADPIPTPAQRWEQGVRPGEDLHDHLDLFGLERTPRIKFKCRTCPRTKQLNIKDAPHIYAYLPYKDVHLQATTPGRKAQDRHLIRRELLANRNASESLNSILKYRCWGLQGAAAPSCVKSYRQMEWITYGRFLSQALRVLVKADGTYDRARDEARHYKLDRTGIYKLLKAARDRLDHEADAA